MTQKMYFLCLKPALVVEGASCKVGRPHTVTAPQKKTLRGAETKQRIFNINVIIIVVIVVIIMIIMITARVPQPNKEEENISFL